MCMCVCDELHYTDVLDELLIYLLVLAEIIVEIFIDFSYCLD